MNRIQTLLCVRRILFTNVLRQSANASQLTWIKTNANDNKPKLTGYQYRKVSDKLRQDVIMTGTNKDTWFIKSGQNVSEQFNVLLKNCSSHQLKPHMQRLDTNLLVKFVMQLANVDDSVNIYSEQWQAVEQELSCRVNEIDTRTLLLLADAMYMSDYRSSRYLQSLTHSWALQWQQLNLSPANFLHLLFYLGVNRNSPIELMCMCEEYVEKNINEFTGPQLSVICYSFFNSNTAFRSFSTLTCIADATIKQLPSLSVSMLTNILKVLRHGSYTNVAFFEAIGDALCEYDLENEQYLSTLTHLVYPFASVGIRHERFFKHVMNAACRIVDGANFRSKDLVKILWSYSTLKQPIVESLVTTLLSDLRSNPSLQSAYPEVFVEGVVSLVLAGKRPMDLISRVLANNQRMWKTSQLEQNYQRLLLDSVACNLCTGYNGNKLNKRIAAVGDLQFSLIRRQGLLPLFAGLQKMFGCSRVSCHFVLDWSQVPDIELWLDETDRPRRLPASMHYDQMKAKMQRNESASIISQMLGCCSLDAFDRTLPENQLFKPNSEVTGTKKLSIKVMGWNQYTLNDTTMFAMHRFEINMLNHLGYHVLVINPQDANQLSVMSPSQISDYIHANVISACNISHLQ